MKDKKKSENVNDIPEWSSLHKDQSRLLGKCLVQSWPTQNEPRTQFMQNKLNEGQDFELIQ
jgi:hypothetical protein